MPTLKTRKYAKNKRQESVRHIKRKVRVAFFWRKNGITRSEGWQCSHLSSACGYLPLSCVSKWDFFFSSSDCLQTMNNRAPSLFLSSLSWKLNVLSESVRVVGRCLLLRSLPHLLGKKKFLPAPRYILQHLRMNAGTNNGPLRSYCNFFCVIDFLCFEVEGRRDWFHAFVSEARSNGNIGSPGRWLWRQRLLFPSSNRTSFQQICDEHCRSVLNECSSTRWKHQVPTEAYSS